MKRLLLIIAAISLAAVVAYGQGGMGVGSLSGPSVGVPGGTVAYDDTTEFSRSLLDDPDAAAARATLGVGKRFAEGYYPDFPGFEAGQTVFAATDGAGDIYPALTGGTWEGPSFPWIGRLDKWFTRTNVQPGFVDAAVWEPGDEAALYVLLFSTDHSSDEGGIYLAYRVIPYADLEDGSAYLTDGTQFTPYLNTGATDLEQIYVDTTRTATPQTETPWIFFDYENDRLYMTYHNVDGGNGQYSAMAYSTDMTSWTRVGAILDSDQTFDHGQSHTGYMGAISTDGTPRGIAGPYKAEKSWSVIGIQPLLTSAPIWHVWKENINPPYPPNSNRHLVPSKHPFIFQGRNYMFYGSRDGTALDDNQPLYVAQMSADWRRIVGTPRVVWQTEVGTDWAFGFSSGAAQPFQDLTGELYILTCARDTSTGDNHIAMRRADFATTAPVLTYDIIPTDVDGHIQYPMHNSVTEWEWSAERDGVTFSEGNFSEAAGKPSLVSLVNGEVADNGYEARWQVTDWNTALVGPVLDFTDDVIGAEFTVTGLRILADADKDSGDPTIESGSYARNLVAFYDVADTLSIVDGVHQMVASDQQSVDDFLQIKDNSVWSANMSVTNYRVNDYGRWRDPKNLTVGMMRYGYPDVSGDGSEEVHAVFYVMLNDQIIHVEDIPAATFARFTGLRAFLSAQKFGGSSNPIEWRIRGLKMRVFR